MTNDEDYVLQGQLIDKIKELYRLKHVVRFNTRNVIKKETVAEHTFNVAMICVLLLEQYGITNEKIRLDCITKALMHDLPEIDYNDITYDVKNLLNLRPMLKEYEDKYFVEKYPCQAKLMHDYIPVVDDIVNYADALSVYQYISNEIVLGNKSEDITTILSDMPQRLQKCKQELEASIMEVGKNGSLA